MSGGCDRARRAAIGLGGLAVLQLASPVRAQPGSRELFMQRALEMRRIALERGDQAYGAVVVKDGQVVGEGVSAVITTPDPAIRDAARRLKTRDLAGCELYGTSRACPMCEAGAYWARIERLWYGESIADGGVPRLR